MQLFCQLKCAAMSEPSVEHQQKSSPLATMEEKEVMEELLVWSEGNLILKQLKITIDPMKTILHVLAKYLNVTDKMSLKMAMIQRTCINHVKG